MNQPLYAPPGQPYPQQPQPQQPQFQPQQQFAPQQNLGQAAAGNLFNQFLAAPPRKRADRAKPADGTYVVRFTPNCKIDYSQKDGRPYAILEYQVIEGTVPQMQGQVFSLPLFWSSRMQLEDLADLAKYTFGQNLGTVSQQVAGDPQRMAQAIAQTLAQGYFAGVRVARSKKQVATVGYEAAFANHNWIVVTPPNQPITLAQLNVSPQAMAPQPQQFTPPTLQQQPQYQQPAPQAMMPQPPQQGFQPAPAPAMFQPQPTAPQQPAFPQAPQTSAFPQMPPQQPVPAHYVPNGQPPR